MTSLYSEGPVSLWSDDGYRVASLAARLAQMETTRRIEPNHCSHGVAVDVIDFIEPAIHLLDTAEQRVMKPLLDKLLTNP